MMKSARRQIHSFHDAVLLFALNDYQHNIVFHIGSQIHSMHSLQNQEACLDTGKLVDA